MAGRQDQIPRSIKEDAQRAIMEEHKKQKVPVMHTAHLRPMQVSPEMVLADILLLSFKFH